MFASIETNGATHIVIYVPQEGAEKSLPALAAMLESNATFIQRGYSDTKLVTPTMSIVLGDKFEQDANREDNIVVAKSDCVLASDFVIATPQVLVSNAKAVSDAKAENARLRTEISFLRDRATLAEQRLEAMLKVEEEGDNG